MGEVEKLPGMPASECHDIEADALLDAANDARERGDNEEYFRLLDESGRARERIAGDVLRELRGEE